MEISASLYALYLFAGLVVLRKLQTRLRLSRAKHPSLRGHSKIARRIARLIPFYAYTGRQVFSSDGAPEDIVEKRRQGFSTLQQGFQQHSPESIRLSESIEYSISDARFTNAYRVPFQYRNYISEHMRLGSIVSASSGTQVRDLDGNWSYDLTGSYGVNVFGYDFYKDCIDKGIERVRELGPVLGPYHPLIADNVNRLRSVSGLDEVSFHMSGTEAVMQAVNLARYHTRRSHLVRFCGAYHGWWDGVQPGIGSHRKVNDVYTLKDMDEDTLKVLRTRNDIACVLVNPLQALHPNANAPGDGLLVNSERSANFDREAYSAWLQELRQVCTQKGIVLILDEVFVGFRIAYRGAQEYFGIDADIVTYGKTLGGGLPVGVLCGKHALMKRFHDEFPSDICFARGTFNSHPYVMAAMNEFLRRIEEPAIKNTYVELDNLWNKRVKTLNQRLEANELPVRVANLTSIWTITYTVPSRYNWMFQYYLRSAGLAISWVGSGRLILSHNFTGDEYETVMQRFVSAATAMREDGWWWQGQHLTNRSIKLNILKEMLAVRFGRSRPPRSRCGEQPIAGES
jgi:glutamate-1-semialdehyde 2,1-aminomutase